HLALVRGGTMTRVDVDRLGGRSLRDLRLSGDCGVAAGQGALVLLCDHSRGASWSVADLKLPRELRAGLDFHAVACVGNHIWVAGRPGSVVLHSANRGGSWEVQKTGQPLPLNGLYFHKDGQHGWAVGELGTILATADGGKTWQAQRRGGRRSALMVIHARPPGLPADALASLGGEDGYLMAALCVTSPDPASAPPARSGEALRYAAAVRKAGGAAGEALWQFPVPLHLARCDKEELLAAWDKLHGGQAADQLLRQLVLAIRTWRPDVVLTDSPTSGEPAAPAAGPGATPAEALVAVAVREACRRAGDPKAFPEQLTALGLEAHRPAKVYGCCENRSDAQVSLDTTALCPRLGASARDFASASAALLSDPAVSLPTQRHFRLLDSPLEGAAAHKSLLQGIPALAPGGLARRNVAPAGEPDAELVKAVEARRNLEAMAEAKPGGLIDGERLLALLGPSLTKLPDDQGAPAAFGVANQYARAGQWGLAREAFLLLVERYPAHPLAADACRWLIRHNASSEARRRHDLKQFFTRGALEFQAEPAAPAPGGKRQPGKPDANVSAVQVQEIGRVGKGFEPEAMATAWNPDGSFRLKGTGKSADPRAWYQSSLDLEPRLAAFGPLFAADPSVQFPLQAARRNQGDFDTPPKWYARFAARQPDGPWRAAALAELWLQNRQGPPPKPVAACRYTDTRPFLDGNLDEPCWKGAQPLVLRNAVGKTAREKPDEALPEEYATEAWLAYDQDFLYLALRCRHPEGKHVPPVKGRPRDADVRPYDRVGLLLDLDRDYSTCFHLLVDQRGCTGDECIIQGAGDRSWDPRWFVAVKSDSTCWTVEAAIPLAELTGEVPTAGRTWAVNLVRVLPGRGVQAWSVPADVQPRPEGMGLLIFGRDNRPRTAAVPGPPMPRVP
ncbi:MAG TPA: hypothetical protein VFA26_17665, partial [Gemmataceae bacterium]|nr:hypothetical protein [Gemmataceae bacterium]